MAMRPAAVENEIDVAPSQPVDVVDIKTPI
jgi:hypothetical protein